MLICIGDGHHLGACSRLLAVPFTITLTISPSYFGSVHNIIGYRNYTRILGQGYCSKKDDDDGDNDDEKQEKGKDRVGALLKTGTKTKVNPLRVMATKRTL